MRRIAIVGSGIAGLLTAHGLRRAGHDVTLFSDRTPEDWLLRSRPTGSAGRFDMALSYERELGLNHWEDAAPKVQGAHVTVCPAIGNRLLTLAGRLARPGVAVDVRLQSHRWMLDLEARGGRVEIASVTLDRLDAIAADHDLTIVAAGKGELGRLFERDPARSVYDTPQRQVAMIPVRGPGMAFPGVPFTAVRFNILVPVGEYFSMPYFHKDHGPSWNILFEAREGGPMDRFQGVKSGAEALDVAKQVIRDLAPWEAEWARDLELSDENGWLVGAITPTVRRPVGRLPSGRLVTAVGDAAMHMDPIAGQGANNGTKMARHLVEAIVARGDRPFDAAWMTDTFERFWARHGHGSHTLTNQFLEGPPPGGQQLLLAQYGCDGTGKDGKQAIADAFSETFNDPAEMLPILSDARRARDFIARATGQPWIVPVVRGGLAVGVQQVRQKLGLPPAHPTAPSA